MEEVIYLDQVRLFAVDHPDGTDVYPNEYFAAMPPHPAERTIASRGARLPAGAWDGGAATCCRRCASATPIRRHALSRGGRASPTAHSVQGLRDAARARARSRRVPAGAPVRLLMHGFTDYFTATSVFAAHQAKVYGRAALGRGAAADGSWVRISDDIGFPAGLLRTMTADLTGKLPAGARRIRIWTNLKIYWDQILVDTTPDGAVPRAAHRNPAGRGVTGLPRLPA